MGNKTAVTGTEEVKPLIEKTEEGFSWEDLARAEKTQENEDIVVALKEYLKQRPDIKPLERADIVKGKVLKVEDEDVVVELDYKFNSVIPLAEFKGEPDPQPGDEIEVYVEKSEDRKGQVKLSRRKARILRAWDKLVEAYHTGEVLEAKIIAKTRGGLVAECFGIYECFLPGSQISIEPVEDYDAYVGKTLPVKVVKINEAIMNAVVSHKAVQEEERERRRREIIEKLEPGLVLEGVIKNIVDWGVFVDLGSIDGLVYISDLTWRRIKHPSDLGLKVGDKVRVVVLGFDEDKTKISLGMKQLEPDPWENITEKIKVGDKVKGKVVHIQPYGAFIEVLPGVEGLVHVSEISWGYKKPNPFEYFKEGQEVEAVVTDIDPENRRMSLSIKRLKPDPWENIESKYVTGNKYKGKVIELRPYGALVELEEGVYGIVRNEDLSWTKRVMHPSEIVKEGDEIDVVVLGYDHDKRLLKLGHKQVEENPWHTFETVFTPGSIHKGTIKSISGSEAIVELPYGVEARAQVRDLKKEDGTIAQVDETLDFMVVDFNKKKQLIKVSHTKVWRQAKEEEKARQEARKLIKKKSKKTTKAAPKAQKKTAPAKPKKPQPRPSGAKLDEFIDLDQLLGEEGQQESSDNKEQNKDSNKE